MTSVQSAYRVRACPECGADCALKIYEDAGVYFLGYRCECGHTERATEDFETRADAYDALMDVWFQHKQETRGGDDGP